jgi:MEDS: MEthanogen/methylotroph, DcmR Sensory domain
MAEAYQSGLPGLRVEPGDHICALYFGRAERDRIVMPYLSGGLRDGDKCLCYVDDIDLTGAVAELGTDLDLRGVLATRQLEVHRSAQVYGDGERFSAIDMIQHLAAAVDAATGGEGYQNARVVGDMTWALTAAPGVEELVEYESEINQYSAKYPQILLCLYDLEQLFGTELVYLLRTHPKLLLGGGMVLDNPHFLTPDEMRASRS